MAKPLLKLVHDAPPRGPSPDFIALTRNPKLAADPPRRFEPTPKAAGDVII